MPTKRRKEQSPEPDVDLMEADLVDLTPSNFKFPFVAPSPDTHRIMVGSRRGEKRQDSDSKLDIVGSRRGEKRQDSDSKLDIVEEEVEKSSLITKEQILFEQRKLQNWEDICLVTEKAMTNTVRTIIFYALMAFLIGRLGSLVMKKYIS
ncbi:hypothetical protein EAF04_005211 [Stromatinia cepivora]|nr:hypothetical protein EAF04_005211 [Stromatinia cepivora]